VRLKITPSLVTGEVLAPPSKSYTHRALILAALAAGESTIENPLIADDTDYTIEACRALGADIAVESDGIAVKGTGGKIEVAEGQTIFAGNSASTIRMIAPLAASSPTRIVLDGDERLRQRPMGDLLSALQGLGVHARSLNNNGCPPFEIQGGEFKANQVSLSGAVSSQPVSALLMAAPYTRKGLTIKINGGLRSRPYIDITLEIMRAFGVEAVNRDYKEFLIEGGQAYQARRYRVEGDYSSAAYFLAAGAIGGKPVSVTNLKKDSVQGDKRLLDIIAEMGGEVNYLKDSVRVQRSGALRGISIDMGDYPDLAPTLAVVAAFAQGKTELTNIAHLRFKESDRINDTAAELNKMNIKTEVSDDKMAIYGGRPSGAELDAHNDHRLAMSLSLAALFAEGNSIINGAEAVSKSYPQFFDDLKKLGAKVEELS
jgi:3-phosphoshikimate 1-carboxyvinyltransferase